MILLLFDPFKLDISDEMRQVIHALRGHDDKVRVVLNKADQVDQAALMRVYGALMWSLGKVRLRLRFGLRLGCGFGLGCGCVCWVLRVVVFASGCVGVVVSASARST